MEEEEEEDDPADEDGAPKVTCMDRLHGFVETFPIMGDPDSYVIGSESEFRLTDTYYYYHTLSSCTERLRYYVYNNMYIYVCTCIYQWIGLRENLQETIDVPMNYGCFLYFFPYTNPLNI